MENKIIRTIIRITALCMAVIVMDTHAGTSIANAKQDAYVSGAKDYQYLTYVDASNDTIYSLKDSRNYGVAGFAANSNTRIDFEGLYGLRINIEDGKVWYSAYKHNKAISETATIKLYKYKLGDQGLSFVRNFGTVPVDTDKRMTVKLSDDTIYVIGAAFEIDGIEKTQECYGYLYQTDGEIYTCRIPWLYADGQESNMRAWAELLADADPDDYLSNAKITYPTSGSGNACNHVAEWEAISDELVLHDDWTDELKVYVFVDYLSKNIAYDSYRYSQPNHASRASIANDYTDDSNFTLMNHVGVCWDYANILTIMCRHHGIPCTSVENTYHAFNAVWLGDEWVGIDLTETNRYECDYEDTDKELWTKNSSVSYHNYGMLGYNGRLDTYNESVWTREKGLGLK